MMKNKIAIITPFLAQGGLEKVAITGAKYLDKYYDVTLFVFDTFQIDYKYDKKIVDLNVPLYGQSTIRKIFSLLILIKKINREIANKGFDQVIVHGELANIATLFLDNKVVVIHENRFAKKKSKLKNKIFNLFAKNIYNSRGINKIVTVSEGIRETFIEKFSLDKNKILTIHNPYEIDKIICDSNENLSENLLSLFQNYDVLLIAARLSEQKGHKYFFNVYNNYIEKNSKVKLVLLGDGELKEELINFCLKLKLKVYNSAISDNFNNDYDVYFLGFDSNPYKYMKNSKIFIMSSLWEGFGNTLVESMACGTPVISTDCKSGPKEIISNSSFDVNYKVNYSEFGVLVPPFDSTSDNINLWVKAIDKLLEDSNLYDEYVVSGAKRAKDFDFSLIMNNWKNLIDSLINENK